MYIISKTISNNVTLVNDSKYQEFIVMGVGVGYNKRVGDVVNEDEIEKKYALFHGSEHYLIDHLQQIDYNILTICSEIKEMVETTYKMEYTSYMYLNLVDHIHNAIYRHQNELKITPHYL